MNWRTRSAAVLLLVGVPLASAWFAGFPPGFAELPPLKLHIHAPEFSTPVYLAATLALIVVIVFVWAPRLFGFKLGISDFRAFEWAITVSRRGRFPPWGWVGLCLIVGSWPAAWIRPDWLGPLADHTFFPLWLGYILTVDALVFIRAGASPLTRNFARWLALFPVSAAMWWYFELLNRFIQNWLYLGVEHFSPLRYVLSATLAFTTVIPAVLTTAALLATFEYFGKRFVRTPTAVPRPVWGCTAAGGALGLALMPWFPVALFPLIWLAPLLVLAGLLERTGTATGIGHMLRGDWGPMMTLAVSAVVCGFFWELWNVYAMPKWIYQVPWVNDGLRVFEMPLPGYLGYLPFGPACWVFWLLLFPTPEPSTLDSD